MTTRHGHTETTLGQLTLVADGDALTGVFFPHHWRRPTGLGPLVAADPVLDGAASQLREYLAGDRREFDLVTVAAGEEFEQRVWVLLRQIPYGATVTYQELATHLGDATLARRVGQAVGGNPLSIVVPCHRVVGKDGRLTGYAGGLKRKQSLLELEAPAAELTGRLF